MLKKYMALRMNVGGVQTDAETKPYDLRFVMSRTKAVVPNPNTAMNHSEESRPVVRPVVKQVNPIYFHIALTFCLTIVTETFLCSVAIVRVMDIAQQMFDSWMSAGHPSIF